MRVTRDIQRVLDDERGVSIVFAMLLLVVLLILGGIILSYGYSGYRRATQDVGDEQAAYNVRSAAELVHGQFGGSEPAQWALEALDEAGRVAPTGGYAERTLSVSGSANTFADVTVRVRLTAGGSYDVAVFEKDALEGAGAGSANGNQAASAGPARLNGVAYHFAVGYAPSGDAPDATARITSIGNIEKVGQ